MKFIAVVLAVTLLAITIYNVAPQNQTNRQGSKNNSGSNNNSGSSSNSGSTNVQAAAYWWSMIHTLATSSNARMQSFTPTKSSTSPTVPLTNQTSWVFDTGIAMPFYGAQSPSLAAGSGEVFVIAGARAPIYALNASTGAILWSNAGDAETSYIGIPAFADGVVYADSCSPQDESSPPVNLYAFNATTGAVLWNYTMSDGIASSPTVTDGSVYVFSGQGNIHAFNATTGTQEWNYTINSYIPQSPTVADGVVFASTVYPATVWALNASTGAVLWTSPIDGSVPQSSPAVESGFVYVDSTDNHVYALNESSGAPVWNYTYTAGGYLINSPFVSDGAVYVGGAALCALNASTGGLLWNYTFDIENVQPNEGITTNAIVVDGVVYFASTNRDVYDHDVFALNATSGSLIWSYITGLANGGQYTGGIIWFPPAADNDMVFVGSGEYVYAFGPPSARALSVAISPSYVEMAVSESQVFTSNVTGGNSPYTFQWYLNGTPILGATNSSWTFSPISSGSYSVSLEVIDSLGAFVTSTSASVTAAVPPVFSILNPGPGSCPSDWNASSTVRYMGTPDFVFCSNETSLGSTFVVNITVTNVTDLYAWGIGLVYDNTTLQFVNASLPTDNIFSGATASGDTLIQPPVVLGAVPYNEQNGGFAIVEWGATFIQGSQNWCFNGTGTVAQIEFRIIKAPSSTAPQIRSTFTFDPDWTTTIYWPTINWFPGPLLETGTFDYTS